MGRYRRVWQILALFIYHVLSLRYFSFTGQPIPQMLGCYILRIFYYDIPTKITPTDSDIKFALMQNRIDIVGVVIVKVLSVSYVTCGKLNTYQRAGRRPMMIIYRL